MSLHSIVNFFLLLFFFLPYISKIRGGWRYPQSTKLSVHPRICSNFQPSLEIPSVCDPYICSMFDDYFFFSLSLSFFYSWLLCNVVTLVLGAPRSKKCIVPPSRTGNKSSKAIDDEEPRKVDGNRVPGQDFFSSSAMFTFIKRNSRYILKRKLRVEGCSDSDPAILDFQVPTRWSNNKSWKCWFLNKNHATNICILDCIFYVNKGNKESIQFSRERLSYPSRWKDRYAMLFHSSLSLSNL